MTWVGILVWVALVHKICVRVKKKKDVGRDFGVSGVSLRCFVKKALLKTSQNLQENICAGVSS